MLPVSEVEEYGGNYEGERGRRKLVYELGKVKTLRLDVPCGTSY